MTFANSSPDKGLISKTLIYKELIQLNTKQTIQLKNGQRTNRYMKRCPTSLAIREMQIKTIMRHHLTHVRMAFINKASNNKCGEDMEKKKPSFTAGGNVNWYSHYGNQPSSPQTLKRGATGARNPTHFWVFTQKT